jgi:CSLREA domain-containing protein
MKIRLSLGLAALACTVILPSAASALVPDATITVNTTADGTGGPDCTLRDAIVAANTDTAVGGCSAGNGADTIAFGVSGQIDLGSTLPAVASALTIDGSGQSIVVSGQRVVRVLEVDAGASLTLQTLTVADGDAANAGGILNEGALLVENSTLSDNDVAENFGAGAGIWNTAEGRLSVTDSSFSDNGASRGGLGGGIYNDGEALVQNATFSGDGADTGGAILNAAAGRLAVSDSTFIGNSAMGGGAISNAASTLSIANSSFVGNLAEGGGAILSRGGTALIVSDSLFSGNGAQTGGAIVSEGTVTVARSTFSGNISDEGGGIAFFGDASALFVTDSTFSDNSARDGGGIATSKPATIQRSTFVGNEAESGAGIVVVPGGGEVTVSNSTFAGNTASEGDGGGIDNRGTLTLKSSTLVGNSASTAGGGIANEGTATLANTIVAGSTHGGNCSGFDAAGTSNMADDPTCGPAFTRVRLARLRLGPLANNGGPTETIALRHGSVAIDAGDNGAAQGLITDQRGQGYPRIVGPRVDIGAFEVQRPRSTAAAVRRGAA